MIPLPVILAHQTSRQVNEISGWFSAVLRSPVLVIHGGKEADCENVAPRVALHVSDSRLRTTDHQRERQSYSAVLKAIAGSGLIRECSSVQIFEYDSVPLQPGLLELLESELYSQNAALLGAGLGRLDQTGHPHWLYHVSDPAFEKMLEGFSVREDKHVVLSMLGCVSVWRPDVLMAVAALEEKVPTYLELWLPTAAHHLGYRVRGLGQHDKWISHEGDFTSKLLRIQEQGGWMAHPAKQFWEEKNRGLREDVLRRAGGTRRTQES